MESQLMKNRDYSFIFILFYAGWFGSVFLAKTQNPELSLLFPAALVVFLYLKRSLNLKDMAFAAAVATVGSVFDVFLIQFGYISPSQESQMLIPIWLISIWILFSFSMLKLGPKLNLPLWLAILLGMIMGPLSYKSGEIFEVLTFSSSLTTPIYALFWAMMFPIVLRFSKRLV